MADTDCECKPKTYHGRHAGVALCPLHSAAPELLKAARVALSVMEPSDDPNGRTAQAIKRLEKAIRKAGGE